MNRHPTSDSGVVDAVSAVLSRPASEGQTLALMVERDGRLLVERYGVTPDTPFGPGAPVDRSSTLISWSMAKSITHALVGIAARDDLVDISAPLDLPEWRDDSRCSITLDHLLQMRSGLAFVEDYVDGESSDCIEMLFAGDDHNGVPDMGAFAASKPAVAPPGELFNYSSGTTNIICRHLGNVIAGGDVASVGASRRREAFERFARERLFGPLHMDSVTMRFDSSGTFIGSSFLFATAADFVRFGRFVAHDGVDAQGTRLLPAHWRDDARTPISHDPDGAGPHGFDYGRHWWVWPDIPGSIAAHGYQGQFILVVPELDLTLVHLGITDVAVAPALVRRLGDVFRAVAAL